jgi:mannan endo-1,4-beta-mannosidase
MMPKNCKTARASLLIFGALAFETGCLRNGNNPGANSVPSGAALAPGPSSPGAEGPLKVEPTDVPSAVFSQQGKPFCFSGTNNYYLTYKDREMVDDVFKQAKAMGLKVMRTWAFIDRGAIDDSVPSVDYNEWEPHGTKQGVFFQYWDPVTKSVLYNEGADKDDGLGRLDYVLAKAAENDVKMVLVLTNNWKEFGGMDQYLKWFDLKYHHEFYTSPKAKQAYKSYAEHLINRVNTITKQSYKDDPAIFAWELANEPRCRNYGPHDRLQDCSAATLTAWAGEMSAYIKSLDPNHMVAVGDEGFFNRKGQPTEQYNGKDGADHEAFLALGSIDFGTFHLYPDSWSTAVNWGNKWITDHIDAAQKAGKPTVLEEYGLVVKRDDKTGQVTGGLDRRRTAYVNWNNLLLGRGANASMFWILAGIDPDNKDTGYYQDYDHFSVYNRPDDETAKLLAEVAGQFPVKARACELALEKGVTGPASPFISVVAAPPRAVAYRSPQAHSQRAASL